MAHNNYISQLNTWLFGLNPPKQSFAHIRDNGTIRHVISVQKMIRIKNQRPLFKKLDLPENVGFNIIIERTNEKTGLVRAEIISTNFEPDDAKQEKTFKKLKNKKILIQVR